MLSLSKYGALGFSLNALAAPFDRLRVTAHVQAPYHVIASGFSEATVAKRS
jgi:hypothetical protein